MTVIESLLEKAGFSTKPKEPFRTVFINRPCDNEFLKYKTNLTTTSKYTFASFVPKNLYEQFRRIANIYFLVISVLQLSTDLSPTNKYATIGPLSVVLFVNMMKEAFEDLGRHKSDENVNNRKSTVVEYGKQSDVLWKDLSVGHICRVEQGTECPADMVILSSSHRQGHCYVETANLDGETNLKVMYSLKDTQQNESFEDMSNLKGTIRCEHPNSSLYTFTGTLSLNNERQISIDVSNVLLRGTVLRNTPFVYGIIIFTGQDTKIFQNSREVPSKRSHLEKLINTTLIYIFISLGLLCLFFTLAHVLWYSRNHSELWYLNNLKEEANGKAATSFITFLILFNNLTPISLYVSMEFVRLYQARFIDSDITMYYEEKDTPAMARTSNLNEELGQIQYVLSDKTGTLTCNEMRFSKCSVDGVLYQKVKSFVKDGHRGSRAISDSSSQNGTMMVVKPRYRASVDQSSTDEPRADGNDFTSSNQSTNEQMRSFLLAMSLCHTAIPCNSNGSLAANSNFSHSEIEYQSPSPDEVALLDAARDAGYVMEERTQSKIVVNVKGTKKVFELLNTNEFNSSRKRMSVIVKSPEGTIQLFCKGADSVMMERLAPNQQNSSETLYHIDMFAEEGLRTLVLAMATLSEEQYNSWNAKYTAASTALSNRKELLDEVAAEIETNMTLLGATAVEDRLQDDVPETIQALMSAGIRVWMLTGDKQETAMNIAFSTRLFSHDMHIIKINTQDEGKLLSFIEGGIRRFHDAQEKKEDAFFGLVIDGSTLHVMLRREDIKLKFSRLMRICMSVVACRVSPSQKAEIVSLVKSSDYPEPFTLAIGDGGNDVNMIQEAHIGVGISGKEGMQAVQSSDFAIAQFSYLKELLLTHGKWNYHRMSKFVLYSFYKNVTFVSVLVFFTLNNGYSGTTLFDSWIGAGWNVIWTFLPVIVFAITDKDCTRAVMDHYPHLYMYGPLGMGFSVGKFSKWVANGIIHAAIIYFIGSRAFSPIISREGYSDGLFLFGTIINCALMLVVNAKILFESYTLSRLFVGSVALSVFSWFFVVGVYSFMYSISPDFYHVGTEMYSRSIFWVSLPLIPVTCFAFDLIVKFIAVSWQPTPQDIAREMELFQKNGVFHRSSLSTSIRQDTEPPRHPSPRVAFIGENDIEASGSRADRAETVQDEHPLPEQNLVEPQGQIESESNAQVAHKSEMSKFTLEFINDAQLEQQFRDFHFMVSFHQTRVVWLIAYLLYFMNFILFFGQDHGILSSYSRIIIILLAGVHTTYMVSTTQKRHYQEIVAASLIVGVVTMNLITNKPEGLLFQSIVPLIGFIIGGLRFKYALPLVLFDEIIYFAMSINDSEVKVVLVNVFFLALIMGISAYGAYFSEVSMRKDFLLQHKLRKEKKVTRGILENMLPSFIVNKIQDGVRVIANNEKSVSILFCEIQDFADIVSDSSPSEFVTLLDKIFDHFDIMCSKYDVQKIETVGPIYMACAGLQNSDSNHALAVTKLAENMLDDCHKFIRSNGQPIKVRIGINTGPVVSGVVGKKKPQFCLFGDTVNTASRMESTAPVSCIQVTASTYKHIHTTHEASERQVPIKGKGVMITYVLKRQSKSHKSQVAKGYDKKPRSKFRKNLLPSPSLLSLEDQDLIKGSDIDPFTLIFTSRDMEQQFNSEIRATLLKNFRYNLILFIFLMIIYLFIEGSGPGHMNIAMTTLQIIFLAFAAVFVFIHRMPKLHYYLSEIAICVYLYLGIILSINSSVKNEEVGVLTTLGVTQAISFFFNYGGLHFHQALRVCLGIVIALLAVIINTASRNLDPISNPEWYKTSPGIMITYLFIYFILNVISKYSKDRYNRRTFFLRTSISKEMKHSNDLLSSMAPRGVLHQLKTGSKVVAQVYTDVAILFSDIVGFTDKSSKSQPQMIVELLSTLFSHFDILTSIHEVYKVQTIGDAYVAVAGIPINETDEVDTTKSCKKMMEFAIGMIQAISHMQTPDGQPVRMRIGLHYGKIVGGVIGRKTLRFDIWGRDVLTAASMESKGTAGKLHMSEAFKLQIENEYELDSCSEITNPGGKTTRTFFYDPSTRNASPA